MIMNKVWFILIANLIVISLNAQHVKEYQGKVSYEIKVGIDSFRIYSPFEELKALDLSVFTNDLISTPPKACQAFISFTKRDIGKELASDEYGTGFPSDNTLNHRNEPKFQKNRYLKVYFVLYFKYNNANYSITYIETYADESLPRYYTVLKHKYVNGKWLLADNWYLSRFRSLSKLKPQFAQSLILGKPINGNNHFNTLLNAVYLNNSIDIGVLDDFISNKEFGDLLNN